MPIANPWTARAWQEFRADNLTRAYRDVLLTLATFRGSGGSIHPAHATLAARAKCSIRTVARALAQGAQLGLVSWRERRRHAGWRWLRTSNSYRLEVPDQPARAELRLKQPRAPTNGQFGRGGERVKKEEGQSSGLKRKEELAAMVRVAASMPDLLAARRKAVTQSYIEDARRRLPASSPPLTRPYGFGA